MTEINVVDLKDYMSSRKDHVPSRASIKFLRAEVPAQYRIPFAVIRYALEGVEQDDGLRLDLGKQVFIDHFEDEEKEHMLKHEASPISKWILASLSQSSKLEGSLLIRLFGDRYGVSFAPYWGSGSIGIRWCHGDEELTVFLQQLKILPKFIDNALQDLNREGHALLPNLSLSREEIKHYGL